jgi:hypothetical protein
VVVPVVPAVVDVVSDMAVLVVPAVVDVVFVVVPVVPAVVDFDAGRSVLSCSSWPPPTKSPDRPALTTCSMQAASVFTVSVVASCCLLLAACCPLLHLAASAGLPLPVPVAAAGAKQSERRRMIGHRILDFTLGGFATQAENHIGQNITFQQPTKHSLNVVDSDNNSNNSNNTNNSNNSNNNKDDIETPS